MVTRSFSHFFLLIGLLAPTSVLAAETPPSRVQPNPVTFTDASFCELTMSGNVVEIPDIDPALDAFKKKYYVEHWNFLVQKEKEGFFPFLSETRAGPIQILDLGAGHANEVYEMSSFFGSGRYLNSSQSRAKIYAMDLFPENIEISKSQRDRLLKKAPQLESFLKSVEFFTRDASQDESFADLPEKFEFIFLGHPQITLSAGSSDPMFVSILQQAAKRLQDLGVIYVTVYDQDVATSKQVLEQAGLEIFGSDPGGPGRDAYFFARKKKTVPPSQ